MDEEPPTDVQRVRAEIAAIRWRLQRLELSLGALAKRKSPPPPPAPPEAGPPVVEIAEKSSPEAPPQAPPEAVAQTEALAQPPARPKPSLEQRVGASWLNKIGIVVLVIGVLFLCQLAVQRGWWRPRYRGIGVAVMGLLLLAAGERALRKAMRLFAAGMTGGGIALLYTAVYIVSPKVHKNLLSTEWAFALMCVVTVIGVALSLRSRMITTALLAQIGAYLTPVLLRTGRNEQVALMAYMLAVAAGFLLVSALKRWDALGLMALAGTAVVFGLWFARHYDPPQWLSTALFAWGFAAAFLLHAVAGSAGRRIREETALVLVFLVAALMAGLWVAQMGDLAGGRLPAQLLVLAAVLLALTTIRRWRGLSVLWAAGAAVLFSFWFQRHYPAGRWAGTNAAAWGLFALFAAYAVAATAWRRTHRFIGIGLVAGAAAALAGLWLAMSEGMSEPRLLGNLIALDAVVLGACLWRRWHWLRAGALGWTVLLMAMAYQPGRGDYWYRESWAIWVWLFFSLFVADVLVRAWWRGRHSREWLDASLATAATGMMFGATYYLLRGRYQPWMGAYTAALAAAAISLAWSLRRRAGRRILAYAFLGQGLVLVTLAMPIQFDKATVTLAWAAQSTVAMLLASRLKSRLLLAKAPLVLILAIGHFWVVDIPTDQRLSAVLVSVGGTGINYLLLLAAAVTASAMLSAMFLRAGRPLLGVRGDRAIACALIVVGAAVWGQQTCQQLPVVSATWWWLGLAAAVGAWGLWRRSRWLSWTAGVMLAATAAKLLLIDTLGRRLLGRHEPYWPVVLNWQLAAGCALAAACLAYARGIARRLGDEPPVATVRLLACLLGAFLVLWAGSFEVDRYFGQAPPGRFANIPEAAQMGYSVWWAVYAGILLVVGFLARRPPIRYMALAIFAVTLAKALLVDLSRIELAYRVASFLALGGLLVAASLLYQRYFREALASWDKAGE